MLQQAIDFRDECAALFQILDPLSGADWSRETQFKHWTIDDVVAHLHIFNVAAGLSLTDESAFTEFMAGFNAALAGGRAPEIYPCLARGLARPRIAGPLAGGLPGDRRAVR